MTLNCKVILVMRRLILFHHYSIRVYHDYEDSQLDVLESRVLYEKEHNRRHLSGVTYCHLTGVTSVTSEAE